MEQPQATENAALATELKRQVCSECGAVAHGNLFCNTCRQCMNATIGCSLPPWPHAAEKPCGAREVLRFVAKLDALQEEASAEASAGRR